MAIAELGKKTDQINQTGKVCIPRKWGGACRLRQKSKHCCITQSTAENIIYTQLTWADFLFEHSLLTEDLQFLVRPNGQLLLFDTGIAHFTDNRSTPHKCSAALGTRTTCACRIAADSVIYNLVMPALMFLLRTEYAAQQLNFSEIEAQYDCKSLHCDVDRSVRKKTHFKNGLVRGCSYSALPTIAASVEEGLRGDQKWNDTVRIYTKMAGASRAHPLDSSALQCAHDLASMRQACMRDFKNSRDALA